MNGYVDNENTCMYVSMTQLMIVDSLYIDFIQEYSDYHGNQYRFLFIEMTLEDGKKMSHVEVFSKMINCSWKSEDASYLSFNEKSEWSTKYQSIKDYIMGKIDEIVENGDSDSSIHPIILHRNLWNEGQYHEIV